MESTDNQNVKEEGEYLGLPETAGDLGATPESITEKMGSLNLGDLDST